MDKNTSRIFLFLLYFAQGTIFIVQSFGVIYDPGIVHPLGNIVDPSVLFSLSLLFVSFILMFSMKNKKEVVLVGIVLGVIPMIKIYTSFLAFVALGVTMVLLFMTNKKEKWLFFILFAISGFVAGILYAPINLGVGKLIFAPFLFYTHFLESYAGLNKSDWWLRMLVYFDHNNYLRIIQNYGILLLFYFIPTLSLRLLGLFKIKEIFHKEFYTERNIFLCVAIVAGFILPSFFIQNIAVFVVIQFLWVVYILLLIPTAFSLGALYNRISVLGKGILIAFILILSIPDTLTLLKGYSENPTIIPSSVVSIAKEMKKLPHEGIVIVNTKYEGERLQTEAHVPIISAISQHAVYYEPEVLEFTGLDQEVMKRRRMIADLHRAASRCGDIATADVQVKTLLKEMNSSYIVSLTPLPCLSTLPSLMLISEKGEAALYKLR